MEMASGSRSIQLRQIDDEKYFIITQNIMTAEEFTVFTENRISLNQNILCGIATKNELLLQIELELIILCTCKNRIEEIKLILDLKNFDTKIETIFYNRIHDMYIILFKTFNYDADLVSKYIKYCFQNKKIIENYKTVLDGIMDSFNSDPEIYLTGAHHAFNDCNDIESARRYISIGISYHGNLKKFHIEDFWMEVQILNQTGDMYLQGALKKYKYIIQLFKDDIDLHFDLVDTALDEHIKITQLQCMVIRDMVNKYRKNELMWQKLAKIHLRGFFFNYNSGILRTIQRPKQYIFIWNCINTYDKALKENLSPESQQNLWDLYLDDIMDIQNLIDKNDEENKYYINRSVTRIFDRAYSTNAMKQSRHFIYLAEQQGDDIHAKLSILKRGVNIIKDDFDLLTKLFEYYIHNDFLQEATEVLLEVFGSVKSKSLPLWEVMEVYVLNTDEDTIEEFYKASSELVVDEKINLRFRPKYLEWHILTYNIESGRKVFDSLKSLEPKSYDLYKKMLKFETINIVSDESRYFSRVRKLYNEACRLFGHLNLELWYDRIKFEYMYGDPESVDIIFEAGLNILANPSFMAKLINIKHELDEKFKESDATDSEDD